MNEKHACYGTFRQVPHEYYGQEYFRHALYHNDTAPDAGERIVPGYFVPQYSTAEVVPQRLASAADLIKSFWAGGYWRAVSHSEAEEISRALLALNNGLAKAPKSVDVEPALQVSELDAWMSEVNRVLGSVRTLNCPTETLNRLTEEGVRLQTLLNHRGTK